MTQETPLGDAPLALSARDVPIQTRPSIYPGPLAERVAGRAKRPLGRPFGLSGLGVNLTTLAPGAQSALMHRHTRAEEFIYVVEGRPTLRARRRAPDAHARA